MSVYVDDTNAPLGRMLMCHMIADTPAELFAMAERIGVPLRWLQYPGTPREHFDICRKKRRRAVYFGAIEITRRELVRKVQDRTPEVAA